MFIHALSFMFTSLSHFILKIKMFFFRSFYPRYPSIEAVKLDSDVMSSKQIDFRNVMNPAPVAIQHTMSFAALYSVFRNLGLRHIVVVSTVNP